MTDREQPERDTVRYVPPRPSSVEAARPARPVTPGEATLIITRGPRITVSTEIVLTSDVTSVGRHPECDVVLDDATVSRRHAELRRVGGGFTVIDLGSLNGTYVNRKPVDQARLADGDEVWIGVYRLVFRCA